MAGVVLRRQRIEPRQPELAHGSRANEQLSPFGARLQSDGFYYYAYLRSLTFDRDVEFSNDYRMLGLGDKAHLFNPTPTGYAQSAWTIGPAIVWLQESAGLSLAQMQAWAVEGARTVLKALASLGRLAVACFEREDEAGAVPTITTVARLANVSVASASRVANRSFGIVRLS